MTSTEPGGSGPETDDCDTLRAELGALLRQRDAYEAQIANLADRFVLQAEIERLRTGLRSLRASMESPNRLTERRVKVAIDRLLGSARREYEHDHEPD